jgi:hypothetical protein
MSLRELRDGMQRTKTTIFIFVSCNGKWSRCRMGCVPVNKRTLAAVNLLTSKSYIWSSTNLNVPLGKMLGSVS